MSRHLTGWIGAASLSAAALGPGMGGASVGTKPKLIVAIVAVLVIVMIVLHLTGGAPH